MDNAEGIPEWLRNYIPTRDDREQHVRMVVSLMDDHNQACLFAAREVSELYKRLCERRSSIDSEHGDPQDHAWVYDHESGVIDRVVGSLLVVVQGEIARVTECILMALNSPRGFSKDARHESCSMLAGYSDTCLGWTSTMHS